MKACKRKIKATNINFKVTKKKPIAKKDQFFIDLLNNIDNFRKLTEQLNDFNLLKLLYNIII